MWRNVQNVQVIMGKWLWETGHSFIGILLHLLTYHLIPDQVVSAGGKKITKIGNGTYCGKLHPGF